MSSPSSPPAEAPVGKEGESDDDIPPLEPATSSASAAALSGPSSPPSASPTIDAKSQLSAPPVTATSEGLLIQLGHQEAQRILETIEDIFSSQPAAWLPCDAIEMMIIDECGYEDSAELEDALQGTFVNFLAVLPHVELRDRSDGRCDFRMRPDPPPEERRPFRL
eukprot:222993_1